MGLQQGRRIWLCRTLTQAERRCTLTHELVHRERGPVPRDPAAAAAEERAVDEIAARRLITLGSLVDGLATNVGIELTGRAIQGAGSALIAPSALTLLMMIFGANPKELTKALALYGAAAPAGGTAGVFLGGVITEYISWPWSLLHQHPHRRRRSHRHPGPDARRGDGRPWLSRHLRSADRHSRPRCRGVRHRPCPRGRLGLRRDLDRSRRSRGPAGGVRGLPGRES